MLTPIKDYPEIAKDAVFDALAVIFGMTESQANRMFRFSWPSPNGSERFTAKPTTDVCYIRLTATSLSGTGYINDNIVLEPSAEFDDDSLHIIDGRIDGDTAEGDTAYIIKDVAVFAEGHERMDTHSGLRAQFIFYGPHSAEYAMKVRVGFNRSDALSVLKTADMSYVPNRDMPVSMDELIDGNWYSRTDVSLDFYQLIVYTDTISMIEVAPDIHIKTNE